MFDLIGSRPAPALLLLSLAAVSLDAAAGGPPKRLLHYQSVGHSSSQLPGMVSGSVCSMEQGWNAHVTTTLEPLVDYLGAGAFDWWGHNVGGIWPDQGVYLWEGYFSSILFAQIAIARESFPQLADYGPLAEFCQPNGINLYGYIGIPLCDESGQFIFEPVPEHCDSDYFMNWYGEVVDNGFSGIAHDFAAALPPDSPALSGNFATLEANGIEPFIEPVPWRGHTHLLGLSVVAEQWSWEKAADDLEHRYSEEEIVAAGGRAIHLVVRPGPDEPEPDDINQWRFDKSVALLAEGRTVAVNLNYLMQDGFPIELLVAMSKADGEGDDGTVSVLELVEVILNWGPCASPCPADHTGDGVVDVSDLIWLVQQWDKPL